MMRMLRGILFIIMVTSFSCTKKGECDMQGAATTRSDPPLSWDSPKIFRVQKQWNALRESFVKSATKDMMAERSRLPERARALDDILKKGLSEQDLRDLARSCGTLPIQVEDRSPFAISALQYMIMAFVDSGDRDSLVTLLSTRCPDRIGFNSEFECYLAVAPERKKTIKHPILVLGDAYAQCKVPEVRRDIASIVRRGFSTIHVPDLKANGKNDAEYVNDAMKWYRAHADELVPNIEYAGNWQRSDSYKVPLFTWKPESKKQE